jgi:hypothetical protein
VSARAPDAWGPRANDSSVQGVSDGYARALAPDGGATTRTGPLVSGTGPALARAQMHAYGRGSPGDDSERRGRVWRCANTWDPGSTGQLPRDGKSEGLRLGDCGWVPLVGAVVFLGRALGVSAMARAGDFTRAKKSTGQWRLA